MFKANSAILNALLTLLNERVRQRQRAPYVPTISVIGATNAVPGRRSRRGLLRPLPCCGLPVAPVSSRALAELLAIDTSAAGAVVPIDEAERRSLPRRVSVSMPREVAGLLQ